MNKHTNVASVPFDEAVQDVSGGNEKVQKGDYLFDGRFPVIDQGQELVGGFNEDPANVVAGEGPWIVFGDHTRALKYVDFSFCMGADGVKVLKPRSGIALDPKFLFRFLQFTNIPSAGYSRHFKFLRRIRIPLPPLDEQWRIAAILDKADALRRKRKRALELLDGLTQSIFLEMFGDPIHNQKDLATKPLSQIVSPSRKITYGILKPGVDVSDGVPYIRVLDIQNNRIDYTLLRRTTPEIAHEYRRSSIRTGDLLISIRGHVGRMAIAPAECNGTNITQDTARLAIEGANTEFVKAQLETEAARHWMSQRTRGAAVKGINLGDLRQFPVLLPPRTEQDNFACRIDQMRKKETAGSEQSRILDLLFASLQSRAFSGQL